MGQHCVNGREDPGKRKPPDEAQHGKPREVMGNGLDNTENRAEKKAHEAFAAYAVTAGEKDPYSQEIERLKAVVTEQTKLIQTMASQLGVKAEPEKLALTIKPAPEKKPARRRFTKPQKPAEADVKASEKTDKPAVSAGDAQPVAKKKPRRRPTKKPAAPVKSAE